MNIITDSAEKVYPCEYDYNKNFWLFFHLMGSSADFLEQELPYPSYLEKINRGYLIAWAIEGGFNTSRNQAFLNDVIARFLITYSDKKPKRLSYRPKFQDSKNAHILERAYRLKDFSTKLKSLKNREFAPLRGDNHEDHVFWVIKAYTEDLIRLYGICSYNQIESFALNEFLAQGKERSTVRAKCRSVFNWYEKRDFTLPNPVQKKYDTLDEYWEETKMSRTENIIKINKRRADSKRIDIENLTTGVHANLYKKKNGKWNNTSIAKKLGFSINTVKKYMTEIYG